MTATESRNHKEDRLLIIGDLIIDRTWYGQVKKISPEAPIPIFYLDDKSIDTPGGAGFGASFAQKSNIPYIFCTFANAEFTYLLERLGIQAITYPTTNNTIKTRYIDKSSSYHILRVDNDDMVTFPKIDDDFTNRFFSKQLPQIISTYNISGCLILDYRHGVFNNNLSFPRILVSKLKDLNIPVYVDSRQSELRLFSGTNILKVNKKEYRNLINNYKLSNPVDVIKYLNLDNLIITQAEEGATLYSLDTEHYYISNLEYTGKPDVTGCGDVFDVVFCYNYFIMNKDIVTSLKESVKTATKFAYSPVKSRLC